MKEIENHCLIFTNFKFFHGLPAQPVNRWSAWDVKAAVGYNSSSVVLKFSHMIKLNQSGIAPNRAII